MQKNSIYISVDMYLHVDVLWFFLNICGFSEQNPEVDYDINWIKELLI